MPSIASMIPRPGRIAGYLVCLLSLPVAGYACSCAFPEPVLDNFNQAELVVTARLVSVSAETSYETRGSQKWVVEKTYKGHRKSGEEVLLWNGGGAECTIRLQKENVGQKWLLYLPAARTDYPTYPTQKPIISLVPMHLVACNRSAPVERAKADLSFLDRYDELKGKQRVYGKFESGMGASPTVSKLKLRFVGESKVYETETDKDGFFETYELPPGRYDVAIPLLPGWKLEAYPLMARGRMEEPSIGRPDIAGGVYSVPVTLNAKTHVEMRLFLSPSGAVSGRVVLPFGQPAASVRVEITNSKSEDHFRSDTTNQYGEFEFAGLTPGKYFITVNKGGSLSTEQPFRTVYFPDTFNRTEAKLVDVGVGIVESLLIQIPEVINIVTIAGLVIYADGSPAQVRHVTFRPTDPKAADTEYARTTETGEFILRIPESSAGVIYAETYIAKGEALRCPSQLKLFADKSEDWLPLRSEAVSFKGTSMKDLVLKLPVESCSVKAPK